MPTPTKENYLKAVFFSEPEKPANIDHSIGKQDEG